MRPARFGSETPSHASKRSGHAPLEFGAAIAVVDKEMSIAEREINIFCGLVICRDRRLPGHLGSDHLSARGVLTRSAMMGSTKVCSGARLIPASGTETFPSRLHPRNPPITSIVAPPSMSKRLPAASVNALSVTSPEAGIPGGTRPSREEEL